MQAHSGTPAMICQTAALLCCICCCTLLHLAPVAFAAGCSDPSASCLNGVCNTTTGICACPADKWPTFTDARCDNVSVVTGGGTVSNLTQTNASFLLSGRVSFTNTVFQGGFPISDGVLATSIFICSNGYVTFGANFCTARISLLLSTAAPAFVAPFATSFDYRSIVGSVSSSSLVSYSLVPSVDSVQQLKLMRDSISDLAGTTSAIVITWAKMSPPTLDYSAAVQKITMQLIIFTDRQKVTVAAMLYSENTLKHYFDWVPTIVAWKTGGNAAVSLGSSRSSSMAYATQRVSVGGLNARLRILTLYRNVTAPANYGAMCSDESLAQMAVPVVASVASSCPQTLQQARSDPRYSPDAAVTAGRQIFKLILTASVDNATQLSCVYHDATGGLLVQESAINIVSKNVSQGANLFDYCCNKASSQCSLYYTKYPQPSSATYSYPTSAGFVTGAGLFRTFDSLQFKYMGIGDYWLVLSDKLKVQFRMQNINQPAVNNTAAAVAVAVQFTGATNLTMELYWNKTSQIYSWHYSINQGLYTNVTNVATAPQTVTSSNAVIIGSSSKVTCYTQNSATWIEILSGTNGLTVTAYIDKSTIGAIAGLLGNCDASSQNDLAYKNGTVLSVSQQADQAVINVALLTWSVSANESLFRVLPTPPVPDARWMPLYWNSNWDTNQTLLTIALFGGNGTFYNASVAACAAKAGNTTENRHCLMEFADCLAQSCSTAYLARLDSVSATLLNLACSPPQWNSTAIASPLSVKEGAVFTILLPALTVGGSSGKVFSKVAGPAGLSVSADGNLTWAQPNQTDATAAPIVVGLGSAAGCTSLWPVRIRLTRRDGLCPANSAEGFGFQTASVNAVTPQNQVTVSSCVCSTNYYGGNCSFATCPLNCFACGTVQTDCSVACPTNYDTSVSNSLTICAYRDRCDLTACVGSTTYTACVSADPAIQTDTFKYQCSCTSGYQYPMANPADKTRCEDTDECQIPMRCDTSTNRTCVNNPGSFTCNCSQGYELNGTNCVDIDECQRNASICQHGSCSNTVGSYSCKCFTGYYAETSQKCTDINECVNPAISKCSHQCTNTDGGFNCSCFAGFTHLSDPVACVPQNSCVATTSCTYSNLCAKINGTDTCYCLPTQTKSGTACTPTTFCQPNICGAGTCAEASPGYTCACSAYYELNSTGVCVRSQYCTDPTKYPNVCPAGGNIACSTNSTTNAPTCACANGYSNTSANVCVDVDECASSVLNSCNQASTDCYNTVGSYICTCRFGYKRQNATYCTPAPYVYQVNGTFTDLTYTSDLGNAATDAFKRTADALQKQFEAALPPDGTDTPTVRIYSMANGSVVAATVTSYSTPTTTDAIKATASAAGLTVVAVATVNECLNASLNDCSSEHNCIDTDAGYQCQCKIGYTQTGIRAGFPSSKVIADCVDINECLLECKNSSNKICFNTPGSYTCSCVNGTYSLDPKIYTCDDPCVAGRCRNGGACQYQKSDQFPYRCVCTAGYMGFNCELSDDNYIAMQRNAVIVGVVLGVLLLIALIVVVGCIIRKRQQQSKQPDSQAAKMLDTHELTSVTPAPTVAAAPAVTTAPQRSEGNYRGAQTVPMADTSIPRVQESAKHPSTYENQGYDKGNTRPRSDYF